MRVPADSRAAGLQRKQLTEEQVVQKSKRRRNEEAQGQDIPHLEEDWPFFFLSAVKRGWKAPRNSVYKNITMSVYKANIKCG